MAQKYLCPKCGNTQFDTDEIRTTGGRFSKLFNIQNKKFTVVSCTRCRYSELYKGETSAAGNVLDFFTN
jgi:predicted nucleic-acid-binding Zn-ribbon protein